MESYRSGHNGAVLKASRQLGRSLSKSPVFSTLLWTVAIRKTGFSFQRPKEQKESKIEYSESYRSGHNGAVLKTVREKSHRGSNPLLSA